MWLTWFRTVKSNFKDAKNDEILPIAISGSFAYEFIELKWFWFDRDVVEDIFYAFQVEQCD